MSLYDRITELHGTLPWDSVLDAGTGRGSMRWLLGLATERWTAITGSPQMAETVRREIGERQREQDRLIVGNWIDPDLLAGERHDVVLADYLIGAVEAFAPYWQDQMLQRLHPLVGGRLYLVGLEPYVMNTAGDEDGRLVGAIGKLRDACLLLGHGRPYREFPMDWALRQLERSGYRILDAERIAIRYGERFVTSQLDMASRALNALHDRRLAAAMHAHIADLHLRCLAHIQREGGLRHGHDYIIVAEPVPGLPRP